VPKNPFVSGAHATPPDPFNPGEKDYVDQLTYVDKVFGGFLERMKKADKFDDSTVIVAPDHNLRRRTRKRDGRRRRLL